MSRRHDATLAALLTLAVGACSLVLLYAIGAFPTPWPDELVHVSAGNSFWRTGLLEEGYWTFYDDRYEGRLINYPPLYTLAAGLVFQTHSAGLVVMRFAQLGLVLLLLSTLVRWWLRSVRDSVDPATRVLLFACIALNPYLLRDGAILRPDVFVTLAALWLMISVYTGRFLSDTRNAIACGCVFALAGMLHFTAVVLLPIYLIGTIDAGRRLGTRAVFAAAATSALTGMVVMLPYIVFILPDLDVWLELVRETQGNKYEYTPAILDYLFPSLPIARWDLGWTLPAIIGPAFTHLVWVVLLAAIPLVAVASGWLRRSVRTGLLVFALGSASSLFFLRLSEIWFSGLALITLQVAILLPAVQGGPRLARAVAGVLITTHLFGLAQLAFGPDVPSWRRYDVAAAEVIDALEGVIRRGDERVFVSSIPDFSIEILRVWPGLRLTRGMDFEGYAPVHAKRALGAFDAYVVSELRGLPVRPGEPRALLFDWDRALGGALQIGALRSRLVRLADYRVWVLTPGPTSPSRTMP